LELREMTPEQFSAYRHEAVHKLKRLNEECEMEFRISSWPRWDYDFEAGTLTFSEKGIPKVVAEIQVVGTTSISGGTWLWGWANGYLPEGVTEAVALVRSFGKAENIPELTQDYLPDDKFIGWGMTAVAARVLDSKGAYRCPGDNGFVYVVYSSLRFASEQESKLPKGKVIECPTHGKGFATYVCEHLAANPVQEWFLSEADDTNQWPDAWCAVCDAFFQEEGEWNEKNEAKLKISLLCHFCYEKNRAQKTASEADR
jgi:hypothetical protein